MECVVWRKLLQPLSFDATPVAEAGRIDIQHAPHTAPALLDALGDLGWHEEIHCSQSRGVYFRDGWLGLPDTPDTPFRFESFAGRHSLGGPLGSALIYALARQGALTLHASSMVVDGRGYLVLGPSGAGKSTLTLSAIRLGGRVVSDDIVALATNATQPVAVAIRPDIILRAPAMSLATSDLAARMHRSDDPREERWVLPRRDNPALFCDGIAIDAVLLLQPRRGDDATTLTPCSGSDAVGQMLANDPFIHNVLENPAGELAKISRLLAHSRIYACRAGTDVLTAPDTAWRRIAAASAHR